MLHEVVKVTKDDGTDLAATDELAPVNNLLHSMFKPLLNYGPDAKDSHLSSALWYGDTSSKMDILGAANNGYKIRKEFAAGSKHIDLIGHLRGDIFNQQKFLHNGVDLRVKIEGENKSIGNVIVNECFGKNNSKVSNYQNGNKRQLPKRVIIGFVTNKAFNGHYKFNPFNFQHFNMNFFALYVDGNQLPSKPLQPDFGADNKLFVNMYHTLFSGTGIHFLNEGNGISRQRYDGGSTLIAFDLTPDLLASSTSHWNLVKSVNLRIEVGFKEALNETVYINIVIDYSIRAVLPRRRPSRRAVARLAAPEESHYPQPSPYLVH
ncbi:uncharacterized protein LOC135143835 [Zophobas morio]|uniref:uncharacterized protein LOC135143835 n=1 Tax=Zophobas morio TaxID=2755281 RepID=UPI0030832C69